MRQFSKLSNDTKETIRTLIICVALLILALVIVSFSGCTKRSIEEETTTITEVTTTEPETTEPETTTEEELATKEEMTEKATLPATAKSITKTKQSTVKPVPYKEETTTKPAAKKQVAVTEPAKKEPSKEETTTVKEKSKDETTTKEEATAEETEPATEPAAAKTETKNYTDNDLYCLAAVIYREAGACSDHAQLMVGTVVLNRVASSMYPDTIYNVLTQYMQYGMMWKYGVSFPSGASQSAVDRCYANARKLLNGHRECPSNVLGQAEFPSLNGVYEYTEGIYFSYY